MCIYYRVDLLICWLLSIKNLEVEAMTMQNHAYRVTRGRWPRRLGLLLIEQMGRNHI